MIQSEGAKWRKSLKLKQKVTITNNSIKSGLTTDIKKAICEFIWNGFDAGAVNVRVNYTDWAICKFEDEEEFYGLESIICISPSSIKENNSYLPF